MAGQHYNTQPLYKNVATPPHRLRLRTLYKCLSDVTIVTVALVTDDVTLMTYVAVTLIGSSGVRAARASRDQSK